MIHNTYYHDFTSKFWIDTTSFWIIIDWALLARQILLCDYWLYLTGSNLRKWSRQLYLQYLKSCDTDSSCSVIMNTLFLPVVLQSKILSLIFTSVFLFYLARTLELLALPYSPHSLLYWIKYRERHIYHIRTYKKVYHFIFHRFRGTTVPSR